MLFLVISIVLPSQISGSFNEWADISGIVTSRCGIGQYLVVNATNQDSVWSACGDPYYLHTSDGMSELICTTYLDIYVMWIDTVQVYLPANDTTLVNFWEPF